MNRIKNNKGISLSVALLFFAICAVFGSVILATATAASNRVGGLVSEKQSFYTVSSAAESMRDILENTVCEIDCEEESKKTTIKVYYNGEETKLRPLPDKFFNQVKSVYDGSYDGKPQPFSMKYMGNDTLTIDDEASNFKKSNKKDSLYNVRFNIRKEIDGNAYGCQVNAPAAVSERTEKVWKNPEGETVSYPDTDLSDCKAENHLITEIRWPKATIKLMEGDKNAEKTKK